MHAEHDDDNHLAVDDVDEFVILILLVVVIVLVIVVFLLFFVELELDVKLNLNLNFTDAAEAQGSRHVAAALFAPRWPEAGEQPVGE